MQREHLSYTKFFADAAGFPPFPFQVRYASLDRPPTIVEVPTGLGKTETTVLPFIYACASGTAAFRRLVYVLPMRSLVDQTKDRVDTWLRNLRNAGFSDLPDVAVLLGGDVDDRWLEKPEENFILIGTQDMLLSRALNRGYAMSPFRWPIAFGLVNNDAHWVVDEVQLQGVGTRTAAQLQGLREKLGTFGTTSATFLSATIDRSWITTVDHPVGDEPAFGLDDDDQADPVIAKRLHAGKAVSALDVRSDDPAALAEAVLRAHRPGTLTIVVLNQVIRAQELARAIRKRSAKAPDDISVPVELLHSRFRPPDRAAIVRSALTQPDPAGPGRIVVSTQVVEAGVDIDASTLVSELAPWSSIVQRLGRCNRRGDDPEARFLWIDLSLEKQARPYEPTELSEARAALCALEGKSAAAASLPRLPIRLEAGATLRRVDLLDLFDTAPDLSGNDVDVSRFIRESDEFTVSVFWRERAPDGVSHRPRRDELCPAAVSLVRDMVADLYKKGRRDLARVRSVLAADPGEIWRPALRDDIIPGAIVWLHTSVGGYTASDGFEPTSKVVVEELRAADTPEASGAGVLDETEQNGGDRMSWTGKAVGLATHSNDAREEAEGLCAPLASLLGSDNIAAVVRGAAWHDAGKVHDVFQRTMIAGGNDPAGKPWAKAVKPARHERRHFRHELVSALAWLAEHDRAGVDDLIAYLVAAHHGKLRVGAWPYPGEPVTMRRMILGVQDGDEIPAAVLADGERSPAFVADLHLFDVGSNNGRPTWSDRVLGLRDDPALGPFRLAYLETLVRIADWRASAKRAEPGVMAS